MEALEAARKTGSAEKVKDALAKYLEESFEGAKRSKVVESIRTAEEDLKTFELKGDKKGQAIIAFLVAEKCQGIKKSDSALKFGKKAEELFKELGDDQQEAAVLATVIVPAYLYSGEVHSALACANRSLTVAERTAEDASEAEAWYAITLARYQKGKYEDAMDAASKAISHFRKGDDKLGEAKTLVEVSKSFSGKGKTREALMAAQQAQAIYASTGHTVDEAKAMDQAIQCHVAEGSGKQALKMCKQGMQKFQAAGDKLAMCALGVTTAKAYLADNQNMEGYQFILQAMPIYQELGLKIDEALLKHVLAEGMLSVNQLGQALDAAQEAANLLREAGDKVNEQKVLKTLDKIRMMRKEPDLAPHRDDGLKIMRDLSQAVLNKDADEFQLCLQKIQDLGDAVVSADDFTEALQPALERDNLGTLDFLKEQSGYQEAENPMLKPKSPFQRGYNFDRVNTYMFMRFTMMHYGPHFREAHALWRRGPGTYKDHLGNKSASLGVVRYDSCCEEWEKFTEMCHPSILDCALQTQSGMGAQARDVLDPSMLA
eukprot:gnl/TRDRNA2_/TRDRNA2_179764_c0_seq1.p1 gnl/TRDRNA2_/TRDRNA2_179764_c0~~gnl/TRDRNA2_/TRDRNA2_179764_c0_seq1.p1  ORF type:complete len:544 (+),score=177.53 gnl/TRDRNA2_/TRDRNA2_179764_c0_seq1:81-1712(+)